ncbi:MAG TPA: CPBP family glutamic-type intramembrane protease [Acidimicrobiales bacterium]
MRPMPSAGWYPDPSGSPGVYRFWDGSAWTEHTYVAASPSPPSPQPWQAQAPAVVQAPPPPMYFVRPQVTKVELGEPTQRYLGWETVFVMLAFLVPGVTGAVVLFAQHISGVGTVQRFQVLIERHPLENMIIGMIAYLAVACVVPLALLLLFRTGQGPKVLGLGWPGLRSDIGPAIGIIAASWGSEIVLLLILSPLLTRDARLNAPTPVGNVPHYYLIWGLMISATTAIAEEVLMNGYLMTRLSQLGWSPTGALILGIVLRTSYHVYYGIGFVATIPVAYFLTRSFQKRGRLTRPIVAHFLYDAVLLTIAVFTH